jgi:hypothetical protein
LPVKSGPTQPWFDVGGGRDPLAVADGLGRPVAILRMGGRVPDQGNDPGFFFGSPPWFAYPPRAVTQPGTPVPLPAKAAKPQPKNDGNPFNNPAPVPRD